MASGKWYLLKALPALAWGAVITMASMGLGEAERNICSWVPGVEDTCLHGLPSEWIYGVAIAGFLVGIAWFFSEPLGRLFRRDRGGVVPISEALNYLVSGARHSLSSTYNAGIFLRQAAASGSVAIEGRIEISRGSVSEFSMVWQPIPAGYWLTHEFNHSEIVQRGVRWQRAETQPENQHNLSDVSKPTYAGLRISKEELRRWRPPRSLARRITSSLRARLRAP